MRIALLAHLRHPIAPPFAGGLETCTWHLAEGLTARGHDVVLFAAGDSDARLAVDPVIPVHHERSFPGLEHRGDPGLKAHVDAGYGAALDRIAAGGFDVLHNNSLSRLPLERRRTVAVPTVTSLHVPPYEALRWFVHDSVAPGHRITATSRAQAEAWWPEGAPPQVSVRGRLRFRGDGEPDPERSHPSPQPSPARATGFTQRLLTASTPSLPPLRGRVDRPSGRIGRDVVPQKGEGGHRVLPPEMCASGRRAGRGGRFLNQPASRLTVPTAARPRRANRAPVTPRRLPRTARRASPSSRRRVPPRR